MAGYRDGSDPIEIIGRTISIEAFEDIASFGRKRFRAWCNAEPWMRFEADSAREVLIKVRDALKERYPEEFAEPVPDTVDFSDALRALKDGKRITRAGWIDKDRWFAMSGGIGGHVIDHTKFWSPHNAAYAKSQPNGEVRVLPCITMKTASGEIFMGWVPSQLDMFAEDWVVLDD